MGGDESQPAEAAASLSSCQMSPKGWKNRSGLGVLHRARLLAALQISREKSKKCTRLGSSPLASIPSTPGWGLWQTGWRRELARGQRHSACCKAMSHLPLCQQQVSCTSTSPCRHHSPPASSSPLQRATQTEVLQETPKTRLRHPPKLTAPVGPTSPTAANKVTESWARCW